MQLLEVNKIWDKACHNAFTDLIHFKDKLYCAFREGDDHICDDGIIRIISSVDGNEWNSVASLSWSDGDLRDPKFSITPDGELMINGAIRFINPQPGKRHQSVTWFSKDGETWSEGFACESGLNTWRWSTTWHEKKAYSFAYNGKDREGCLYTSTDGKSWNVLADDIYPFDEKTKGNETSLIFLPRGKAFCLLRRDGGTYRAMLGSSNPPYTKWKWRNMKVPLGGPKMIAITQNRFLAVVRLYNKARTSVCWINPKTARLHEALELPSGGDTSYAGVVLDKEILWISYYSSHEDKTDIYLAKVKL